jgi:hypothetical protein
MRQLHGKEDYKVSELVICCKYSNIEMFRDQMIDCIHSMFVCVLVT